MKIARIFKKIIYDLITLVTIILVFNTCNQNDLLSTHNIERSNNDKFSKKAENMHLKPKDIADAHGVILKNFFYTLFNDELIKDKCSKKQLLNNNELPLDLVEKVFIDVVNDYLYDYGYDERISNDEYKSIYFAVIDNPRAVGIYDPLSIDKATTINAINYIRNLEHNGMINPKCSENCVDFIEKIERLSKGHARSEIKQNAALIINSSENADYIEATFKEVYSNSTNTWCMLDNNEWIDDPELKEWWDWFMSTPKGQAIGLVICDAMGGLLSALIAYYSCGALAQIVIPIAGAALASIAFAWCAM